MINISLSRVGFSEWDFEDWMDGSMVITALVLFGIADGLYLVLALPFNGSADTFMMISSTILIWGVPSLIIIETLCGLYCVEGFWGKLLTLPLAVLFNGVVGFISALVLIILESALT